jgi:asparagine synthase (glutamine-hydrolysing)
MLPTFLVSQAIRAHATVALGGDGGDELFGGYWRYPAQLRQASLRRWRPPGSAGLLRGLARRWPAKARGRGWLDALAGDVSTGIANAGRLLRDDERQPLSSALRRLATPALAAPEQRRRTCVPAALSVVQRATRTDYATYLPDDILAKVDRASMRASLEVRAPFLDTAVTEFAFGRLPDALRATQDARKIILRRLGARLLPSTLDLTRKQGFSIPVADWLRGPWRPLLDAAVHDGRSTLIDRAALQGWQQRLDHGQDVGDALFACLVLQRWEQTYQITDIVA